MKSNTDEWYEEVQRMNFTQLLDYRANLKNIMLDYADRRNKKLILGWVEDRLNKITLA